LHAAHESQAASDALAEELLTTLRIAQFVTGSRTTAELPSALVG
jgi:hypothetical protein